MDENIEAVGDEQKILEFANRLSEMMSEASRDLNCHIVIEIACQVVADNARLNYGDDVLNSLAILMLSRAEAPPPPALKH